jgi:hypothetical protein
MSAVVALLVLALVAVAVDRVAAWATERSVVRALVSEGTDVVGATVDIHGFPFLTQVAAGRLDHVTGRIRQGTFGGYRVSDVELDATGVQPRDPYRVESARVDGLLAPSAVEAALSDQLGTDVGVTVDPDAPDALRITVPVLGVELAAVVEPEVVDATTLGVQVRQVSIGGATVSLGSLPGGLGDRIGSVRIPLDLPDGVSVTSVSVEPSGVRVHAEAADVELAHLAR